MYKKTDVFKRSRLREEATTSANCPINGTWEYHCWSCIPPKWVEASEKTLKCKKNNSTIINTTTIAGGVGGGLLVMATLVILVFCFCKSRGNDPDNRYGVDDNPVYMEDYADPDCANEIYDRNVYYAAADKEEMAELSTVVRDNNPEYESCL